MGVTIHFEGKLKSDKDYQNVISKATAFAEEHKMDFNRFEEEEKLLLRVKEDQEWDYNGATKGIRIEPHQNSDPLNLEFDNNNYIQEYCKTQFAGIEIHILIIAFLKSIQSHFEDLKVFDEGEFWQTNDKEMLSNHLKTCFHQIETAMQNDPSLDGPFKIADGRIADLMRNS